MVNSKHEGERCLWRKKDIEVGARLGFFYSPIAALGSTGSARGAPLFLPGVEMKSKSHSDWTKTTEGRIDTGVLESEVPSPEPSLIERGWRTPKRVFASLAHRDFRYLWFGAVLSNIGTWIQMLALGWLVLQLTNSALLLGFVGFAGNLPVFLLALFAGVAADRRNRRTLIIWTQVVQMVLAFFLGLMISFKMVNVASITVLSFGAGIAVAFGFPAWQAIISDLVPRKDLLNAIALNSAQFHMARLLGPALAGLILAVWGVAACFYINAVSFLTVIAALLLIRARPQLPKTTGESIWEHALSGVRYALSKRVIIVLLSSIGVLTVFGMIFTVLMPIFARDILKVGAKGLGYVMAANGLGAVTGALLVAYLAHVVRKDFLIKLGMTTFGLALIVFAFSRNVYLSMAALAVAGVAFLTSNSAINTSLQSIVPNEIRGRVMSLFVWSFMGLMPIGNLLGGWIAHMIGAPLAVFSGATVCLLTALLLIARPALLEGIPAS